MTVTVVLTLKAKDGMFETLEGTMKAILPDTAARDGAEVIHAASDPETKTVIVYEEWDKIESQQAYMGWRQERGDLDKLAALLSEPPKFEVLNHVF